MPSRVSGFRRLPIRLRLTIAFAGVLAAVLAATGVVIYTQYQRDLDDALDADLVARVGDVAVVSANLREAGRAIATSGEGLAQVYGPDGRLLASAPEVVRSRLLSSGEARRVTRDGGLLIERRATPAGEARVRALPSRTEAGAPIVVAVGESLTRRDQAIDRLGELLLIAGPFALLLASYAGYQVARAALLPVERMRTRAEQITERDTAERLPVPPSRDEIEALGHTLNDLLARLDAALARERRLLSDASHELRTPLAVLRTEIQVALLGHGDAQELRDALESAEQEARRLSRLADDLLVLARADQGRLPIRSEPVHVRDLVDAAARRAVTAATAAGREIRTEVEGDRDPVALADPDRAAQALDNLVANALAHGSGEVRLIGREVDGRVELHVTDEGDGFPPALLERAFERFSRGGRARSMEGSGLGLAIARAIADAHGGGAGAGNLAGGGADVWISLPAA